MDWSERNYGDLNGAVAIPLGGLPRNHGKTNTLSTPGDTILLRGKIFFMRACAIDNIAPTRWLLRSVRGWRSEANCEMTPEDMFVAQMNAMGQTVENGAPRVLSIITHRLNVKKALRIPRRKIGASHPIRDEQAELRFYGSQKERPDCS